MDWGEVIGLSTRSLQQERSLHCLCDRLHRFVGTVPGGYRMR